MAVKFPVVAFDLDGTLYPNTSLYVRLVPFLLKEQKYLRAMGKSRTLMRQGNGGQLSGDFYEDQACIMGEILGISTKEAKNKTEHVIYRGWEPIFKKIRPFPYLRDTLDALCNAGVKMGLLSDFPTEEKLKNLNLSEYWYTSFSSEITGYLKPHSAPFMELARRLEAKPEEILYVGNSIPYDVVGAARAGMKAALIRPWWKKWGLKGLREDLSCFVFNDYRQLRDYVLN